MSEVTIGSMVATLTSSGAVDVAAKTAGGAAVQVVANSTLRKQLRAFLRRKRTVLVLGASGSGKTQMIASLAAHAGLVDEVSRQLGRTTKDESIKVIVDATKFVFVDTPGQKEDPTHRAKAIDDALAKAGRKPKIRVINVVSHGWNEAMTPSSHVLVAGGGAVRPDFLIEQREREITSVRRWADRLLDPAKTKWMMTVVNKADLWWDDRDAVLSHYSNGDYDAVFKEYSARLVSHEVVPYCSILRQFYDEVSPSGRFGDPDRAAISVEMMKRLVDAG